MVDLNTTLGLYRYHTMVLYRPITSNNHPDRLVVSFYYLLVDRRLPMASDRLEVSKDL